MEKVNEFKTAIKNAGLTPQMALMLAQALVLEERVERHTGTVSTDLTVTCPQCKDQLQAILPGQTMPFLRGLLSGDTELAACPKCEIDVPFRLDVKTVTLA